MYSGDYVIDGTIGVDLTGTYLSASAGSTIPLPFKPGHIVRTSNNGKYIFVRAESTISTGNACILGFYGDSASATPIVRAVPMTTTNATQGSGLAGTNQVAFAQTSIDSARYGWLQLEGLVNVNLLISCQPKVVLYTTGTAGSLDDATISAARVLGIIALTSATSASSPLCWAHDVTIDDRNALA